MKYLESDESKKLMLLNKTIKDQRFSIENNPSLFDKYVKLFFTPLRRLINALRAFAKIRVYGIKKALLKSMYALFPKMIVDHELKYNPNDNSEFEHFECEIKESKIVVYTAIFGNYDVLQDPLFNNPMCDYIVVTDQEISKNSVWKKYNTSSIAGFSELDNYHKSKYCKIFPHVLFPEYEYSLWVDGNVVVVADVVPLIFRLKNTFMGTFQNPLHDDIFTEAKFLIFCDAAKFDQLSLQLKTYQKEGFPRHFGMREFSIILRRHNDELCKEIMIQWWDELNKFTMRDQISFPYILWRNNLTIDIIQLLGDNWRYNPRFLYLNHNYRNIFKK